MKNLLRFLLVALAFSVTGLLAQAAVTDTSTTAPSSHKITKVAKKVAKKHKKHKKHKVQ